MGNIIIIFHTRTKTDRIAQFTIRKKKSEFVSEHRLSMFCKFVKKKITNWMQMNVS